MPTKIKTGAVAPANKRLPAWGLARAAGLSQQKIAERAGVSQCLVSKVLSGQGNNAAVKEAIADLLPRYSRRQLFGAASATP